MVVDEAPHPPFTRLETANSRVACALIMAGGMAVLGRIAAPNVSTFETHSQVYPCVASRDALGAFPSRWFGDERDLGEVGADRRHHPSGRQTGAGFIGRLIATNMVVSTEKAKRELG